VQTSSFPTAFIPKALKPHLYRPGPGKTKQLDADRYEFLVYRLVRNVLEAGDVFCHDSNEFRRFEDDLISDAHAKLAKPEVLAGLLRAAHVIP
jgi:hypothetical protein